MCIISCKKALHRCNKKQYGEASYFEIIALKLHLAICKMCRQYSKNNTNLTRVLKESELHYLSPDKKTDLKTILHKTQNLQDSHQQKQK